MTKAGLIEAVAARSEVGKKSTEAVINAAMDVIKETVAGGSDVMLVGFGTFATGERTERTGRNPQTGEEIRIPAAKSPKFRPGKAFKEIVNTKTFKVARTETTIEATKTEQTEKPAKKPRK